jgi:hypothetical protein
MRALMRSTLATLHRQQAREVIIPSIAHDCVFRRIGVHRIYRISRIHRLIRMLRVVYVPLALRLLRTFRIRITE